MTTPLALNYSVLGWNHPGFGGSTVTYKKKHPNSKKKIDRFFVSQGTPYPENEQNAIDAVVQFAIQKLGFIPENILLYGWSIGGYTTLWAAAHYPDVKGVVRLIF